MRTHLCGEVTETFVGQTVTVCGWADTRRDHGGVIFIDLRDHTGKVQVVVEPDNETAFGNTRNVRNEYCLRVTANVRARPAGQVNDKLATGRIELVADTVEVLNPSAPLPFQLDEHASEETRLKFRYLDLRRDAMQAAIRLRSRLTHAIRSHLDSRAFLDIETPILTKATPEGARDYLVPSRVNPGSFYALPQSPQLFKQILMMSGMDRYYQIARCFRDEDLRADRQPEFTQLDIEMAFVEREDVLQMAEALVRDIFQQTIDVDLGGPFPRMSYAEAMRRFGSDKPDLRIDLELVDVAEAVAHVEFKVFSGPAKDPQGRVAVLRVPGGAEMTRKQLDGYGEYVARYGAKGLAWIKVNDKAAGAEGLQSPIVKFLDEAAINGILEATGAEDGDVLFFGAGDYRTVSEFMGQLRLAVGRDRGLVAAGWAPLIIIGFPMFEWDDGEQRWYSVNHPFTAPVEPDYAALQADPADAISEGYDVVLNGWEIGGGSIRIHDQKLQSVVFDILGISPDEAQEKFGFLLEALRYGCPPHGGIAFGVDRIATLMLGTESIRDVIAFPKTTSASCLMTDAPSAVSVDQLRELHVSVLPRIGRKAEEQGA
ncbi:MAG: aspartate--tRNA ligase [Pseudomonadota bacterium]